MTFKNDITQTTFIIRVHFRIPKWSYVPTRYRCADHSLFVFLSLLTSLTHPPLCRFHSSGSTPHTLKTVVTGLPNCDFSQGVAIRSGRLIRFILRVAEEEGNHQTDLNSYPQLLKIPLSQYFSCLSFTLSLLIFHNQPPKIPSLKSTATIATP